MSSCIWIKLECIEGEVDLFELFSFLKALRKEKENMDVNNYIYSDKNAFIFSESNLILTETQVNQILKLLPFNKKYKVSLISDIKNEINSFYFLKEYKGNIINIISHNVSNINSQNEFWTELRNIIERNTEITQDTTNQIKESAIIANALSNFKIGNISITLENLIQLIFTQIRSNETEKELKDEVFNQDLLGEIKHLTSEREEEGPFLKENLEEDLSFDIKNVCLQCGKSLKNVSIICDQCHSRDLCSVFNVFGICSMCHQKKLLKEYELNKICYDCSSNI